MTSLETLACVSLGVNALLALVALANIVSILALARALPPSHPFVLTRWQFVCFWVFAALLASHLAWHAADRLTQSGAL